MIEKKLRTLFDFQKFINNEKMSSLISSTQSHFPVSLSEDELAFMWTELYGKNKCHQSGFLMESFQIFLICFYQFIDHRVNLGERADCCSHRVQLDTLIYIFIPALDHGLCHLLMDKDISSIQCGKLIRQITHIAGVNPLGIRILAEIFVSFLSCFVIFFATFSMMESLYSLISTSAISSIWISS